MYRFLFAGRYAFRFLDCIDFKMSTARGLFIFFRCTKRYRILACATPRPIVSEGNLVRY